MLRFFRIHTHKLAGNYLMPLGLVWASMLTGCRDVPVAQDLTQSQAHAIIAALADHGIESMAERAKGSKGLYYVDLDSTDYARAIQVLRDAGLPGEVRPSVAQLLAPDGFLPAGREMELLKVDRAVAGEIEELLSSHPAVISARAVVRSASLSEANQKPSVSVVLTAREAIPEEQIRALVQRVAAGVSPENIMIAVESARPQSKSMRAIDNEPKMSSFLFFWKVPQSQVQGLTGAVCLLIAIIGVIAGVLGFASGTARATAQAGASSRAALPGPTVTGARLRLSESRENDQPSGGPGL